MSNPDFLAQLIFKFITANGGDERDRILIDNPILLTEEVEPVFDDLIRRSRTAEIRDRTEAFRSILRKIREAGGLEVRIRAPEFDRLPAPLQQKYSDAARRYGNRDPRSGGLAELENVIRAWDEIVADKDFGPKDSQLYFNTVAILAGLRIEQQRLGGLADLDSSIAQLQDMLSAHYRADMWRFGALMGVLLCAKAQSLREARKHEQAGRCADEAINTLTTAVADAKQLGEPGAPYGSLGNAYRLRYELICSEPDLVSAIENLRQSLTQPNEDPVEQSANLHNLGLALLDKYEHTFADEDLGESIEILRRSGSMRVDNGLSENCYLLNVLGRACVWRFERLGNLADLQEGIEHLGRAVELAKKIGEDMRGLTDDLAAALLERAKLIGSPQDAKQSALLRESIVTSDSTAADDYARLHNNYGNSLLFLYDLSGDSAVLGDAVRAYRESVAHTPSGTREYTVHNSNYGAALLKRYGLSKQNDDLTAGLEAFQLALAQNDVISNITVLGNLAGGLWLEYRRTGDSKLREQILQLYRKAATAGVHHDPSTVLKFSMNWADAVFSEKDWAAAVEAYETVEVAATKILGSQVLRRGKEAWLAEVQGAATRYAYSLGMLGRWNDAVLALERGQARLLSEALRLRVAMEGATGEQPDTGYGQLVVRLHKLAAADLAGMPSSGLMREYEKTYKELSNFRINPSLPDNLPVETLEQATDLVVYVTATEHGGLAIIVHRGVRGVWLPAATLDRLLPSVQAYYQLYEAFKETRATNEFQHWVNQLDRLLQEIWQMLMGPIIGECHEIANEVTLIPAGPCSLLPLHAAFRIDPSSGARQYALDLLTFQFAPNLTSMVPDHVAMPADPRHQLRMLAVAEPFPVSAPPLPNAAVEVNDIKTYFQEANVLSGTKATKNQVMSELRNHEILHFACHAIANQRNPLESGLLLSNDEILSVREFLGMSSFGAKLAVLSACETALPGIELLDEVVGLPTALIAAGVNGIVASMWSVSDASTAILLSRFYHYWLNENDKISRALAKAQRWIRDASGPEIAEWVQLHLPSIDLVKVGEYHHPVFWAAFTYTGVS